MRKLTVINHMTLDGVMQAPAPGRGHPRRVQPRRVGAAGNDEVMAVWGGGRRPGALADRTYGVWPNAGQPLHEALNKQQKYVASRP